MGMALSMQAVGTGQTVSRAYHPPFAACAVDRYKAGFFIAPKEGSVMRAKYSREGQLRIEQRMDEMPDIFVMRAFVKALPHLDPQSARAAVRWMFEVSIDPKTWQKNEEENLIEFGQAFERNVPDETKPN